MENLLSVAFEAHHPEKNHHRRYEVVLGRDLLAAWTVAIRYGRTGQWGRELRYASADREDIRAVIRDRLRRRLSAPRRIGCPYRLAAFSAAPGFDATAWLLGDILARFFQDLSASWRRMALSFLKAESVQAALLESSCPPLEDGSPSPRTCETAFAFKVIPWLDG